LFQIEWDLELLYAKLGGAHGFPSDVASTSPIALPENKTIQFPLQLYGKAYYRKIYDAASRDFLAAYPAGEIQVASSTTTCSHAGQASLLCMITVPHPPTACSHAVQASLLCMMLVPYPPTKLQLKGAALLTWTW